jgi:hypothetical protein
MQCFVQSVVWNISVCPSRVNESTKHLETHKRHVSGVLDMVRHVMFFTTTPLFQQFLLCNVYLGDSPVTHGVLLRNDLTALLHDHYTQCCFMIINHCDCFVQHLYYSHQMILVELFTGAVVQHRQKQRRLLVQYSIANLKVLTTTLLSEVAKDMQEKNGGKRVSGFSGIKKPMI